MLDQKPYLLRAIYEWILDSGYTPYMQVMVDYPDVEVPSGFDEKGIMLLNISPQATNQFQINAHQVSFWARFRGQPMAVNVPVAAVLAIFAKENGEGMGFDMPEIPLTPMLSVVSSREKSEIPAEAVSADQQKPAKRDRSHLRVIK